MGSALFILMSGVYPQSRTPILGVTIYMLHKFYLCHKDLVDNPFLRKHETSTIACAHAIHCISVALSDHNVTCKLQTHAQSNCNSN